LLILPRLVNLETNPANNDHAAFNSLRELYYNKYYPPICLLLLPRADFIKFSVTKKIKNYLCSLALAVTAYILHMCWGSAPASDSSSDDGSAPTHPKFNNLAGDSVNEKMNESQAVLQVARACQEPIQSHARTAHNQRHSALLPTTV
jgi:hypothetical protein